ncbi:tRNA (adenosine(37)-N6)-threonylcarbamoyltransferase complex dimerization subunit type 1 TsaB [Gellertiella hungarica]|uniref:N6-L-threonylcarbamoyladenine synthase n=1 Tax=Gellertiella hungarica TaxID=1572859 RepID=A0A7W6J2Z7_9HYPH|nr:tRNA (adenosine(37)-N6)-threonylcarbamoyltransferase complex dimerization subunit type 1 TsaB [Gellertiella hungarica]MBB4063806.1 N6-L-threonylcarbamoyladenine synthase [Gellertiella hungarica]
MIVLALDTAGVDCSAALYDGAKNRILAERTERLGKGHAERLTDMVQEVLSEAGLALDAVERIGVTVGPGSFTGIRTGVAAARGFALALGVPAVGITTLEVLAADWASRHPGKPVVAAIDAKRGEVYAQAFAGDGSPVDAPVALDVEAFRQLAARHGGAVAGSAASLLAAAGPEAEPDRFPPSVLARLAHAAPVAHKPKPLYLRAPDAKPQAGFALSRT